MSGGKKAKGRANRVKVVVDAAERGVPVLDDGAAVALIEATLEAMKEERKAHLAGLAGRKKDPYYWGLVGAVNALGGVLRVARSRAAGPHGLGSSTD